MLKIYKSGNVELTTEPFQVTADMPVIKVQVQQDDDQAEVDSEPVEEQLYSDNSPAMLDPQAIEAIFADAQRQAAQIISNARQKASEESDAIKIAVQREAASLRSDGYAEGQAQGYAEGAAAKVAAIEQTIERLEEVIAELEGGFSGFVAEYESNLKWAVAEVSAKVLGRIIERDELELVELVKDAVDQVKNAEWIDLHLCRDSMELIDRMQRELAPIRNLEIVPDDLPAGSCLLDIPSGKLDASIDAQMDNLREYFRSHTLDL